MKAETCMFRPGDAVVLAVLIAACVLLFLLPLHAKDAPLVAEITQNGETVQTVDLSSLKGETSVVVGGCTILLSPDGVQFQNADCPNQLCVKTGAIRLSGESIVCVPNRVAVTLKTQGAPADFDVVTY